jgi:hypothetical protein
MLVIRTFEVGFNMEDGFKVDESVTPAHFRSGSTFDVSSVTFSDEKSIFPKDARLSSRPSINQGKNLSLSEHDRTLSVYNGDELL